MRLLISDYFKTQNQIDTIILLRVVAIFIQCILVFFVSQGLAYQLPLKVLALIISIEIIFTLSCYLYYRDNKSVTKNAIFAQLLADVVFLSLLLYFSGGATNAFVSLLLIPIAISAVTLPLWMLTLTALLAISAYSFMLWLMPIHMLHGDMQRHFIGMWVNFLFSTLVVAMVVSKLARSINKKEHAIAKFREKQLKQEKLIALGIASAQVTHQLATPLATAQLLVDELSENYSNNEVVKNLQTQLQRCGQSLHNYRQLTFDIKNQQVKKLLTNTIVTQITDYITLNFPNIELLITKNVELNSDNYIFADGALLPAILNLINNAIRATKANDSNKIVLTIKTLAQHWQFTIRDFGLGFSQQELSQLGVDPVVSEQGFGLAVFLSHASLERLGGKLTLTNHADGGALVSLQLPLTCHQDKTTMPVITGK